MIIDQLPATVTDNLTDEVPVEQGQLTYKTTWQKIKALFLGTTALPTTAQTISGAIAELDSDKQDTLVSGTNIKTINTQSLLGSGNIDIDVASALYLTSVACSAMTGDFASVSNANITADYVVASVAFANPPAITSDVTWTTGTGTLTLNGTCASATTASVVLVKKSN